MGYQRDEVIGRRITKFVTEESRQLFQKESLPRLLRTGVATDIPRQLVTKSGELIDTLISTIVERDDTGEPAHFLSVIVDVTERKRAEEALKESETRLSIAHAVAGVGSWDLDMVNEEMYWSDQTYEILGLSPAQVAPSASQFLPLIHHEDRADVDATMETTLEDRHDTEMEYRIVRPDGAQRTVVSRNQVEVDEAGQLVGIHGTILDITERKQAEEALRESEARYRDLVELSPDAISIVQDDRFRFVNDAAVKLFGAGQADNLIGRSVLDLRHPDYHNRARGRAVNVLAGQTVPFVEMKLLRCDGSEVFVEAAAAP